VISDADASWNEREEENVMICGSSWEIQKKVEDLFSKLNKVTLKFRMSVQDFF
jgi:hypothetical protein